MTEKSEVDKIARAIREASKYDKRPTDKFFSFVNTVITFVIGYFIFMVVFSAIFWLALYIGSQ